MSDTAEVVDLASKTVTELKAECKARNLPVSGKKSELISRLEDYMTKNEGAEITEDDLLEEPDVSLGEESQENVSTNLISSKIRIVKFFNFLKKFLERKN